MRGTETQVRWAQEIVTRHLELAQSHLPQITTKLQDAVAAADNEHWGSTYERARLAIACDYANRIRQWHAADLIDAQTLLTSPYAIYDAIWTVINKMARADLGLLAVSAEPEDRPTLH